MLIFDPMKIYTTDAPLVTATCNLSNFRDVCEKLYSLSELTLERVVLKICVGCQLSVIDYNVPTHTAFSKVLSELSLGQSVARCNFYAKFDNADVLICVTESWVSFSTSTIDKINAILGIINTE